MRWTLPIALSCAGLLTACANQHTSAATNRAVQETRAGAAGAAMTPLRDLNLTREQIPVILQQIDNPYDIAADITCEEIAVQIEELNAVLGPDWDALPRDEKDPTVSDYAADEASEEVLDIIADEASALIPYRSWVRRLSGAKSHQKKVKRAIQKGSHRRTYLKAIGLMKECDGIAAPRQVTASETAGPSIEFKASVPPRYAEQVGPPIEPFEPKADPASDRFATGSDDAFALQNPADVQEEPYPWAEEEWSETEWPEDDEAGENTATDSSPASGPTSSFPTYD